MKLTSEISVIVAVCYCAMMLERAMADAPITALAIAPDGQQIVTGSQAGISLWRLSDQTKVRDIATTLEHVHDVVFSPDGQYLLAVGGAPAEVGAAELLRWPSGELHKRMSIGDDLLLRAAWASDSSWFATSGHDGLCRLLTTQGESIAAYTGHSRSVLAVTVPPQDRQVISAGIDATIQLWSVAGERQRSLTNHTATVTDVAWKFNADQSLVLASASEDRSVRLWQPQIGRMVKFLRLESVPRRVAWHPNGQLFTACDDGSVHAIDHEEMKLARTLKSKIQPIHELAVTKAHVIVAGVGGLEVLPIP